MSRAQAEIIGITLLIGFVLVSAGAVFVVGSSVLSPLEAQSEQEQQIDEMESVAHEIDTMMRTGQAEGEVGLEGSYSLSDDGASISFYVDGEEADTIETGQLEHEGLIYEGGLVVHEDDGQVVSSPSFELTDRSSHIHIPKLDPDANSFDGALSHNGTSADIDAPEEELEIVIESEYYEEWADEFDTADSVEYDDGEVTIRYEFDHLSAVDSALNIGMSDGTDLRLNELPALDIDSYDDGEYDPDNPREEAVLETAADQQNMGNNDFDFKGKLNSSGDVRAIDEHPNRAPTRGAHSFQDVSDPVPSSEFMLTPDDNFVAPSGDLTGNVYQIDEDYEIDDEKTVRSQSALVVDGDLKITGDIIAEEPVDVFVHGTLELDGATIETPEGEQSDKVSLFVDDGEETTVETRNEPQITGLLHASNSTIDITGDFQTYGAIVADSVEPNQNHNHDTLTLHYDERLEDRSTPYATDLSGETATVPEPAVDPDNFDADIVRNGSTSIDDDKDGNVRINGDLEGIDERTVDGDLLVDGNVADELDEAKITGDLLVTGDVEKELDEVDIGGDLRIAGSLDDELDETDVGGDLVIGGDVDDGGLDEVEIGSDLRITGDLHDELDEVEVERDLIVHGDVTDELDEADIGRHLVIGGDLSDELDEIEVTGDVFVGGAVTDEIDEAEIDGDLTVWGGIDEEVDEVEIDGDLMVDGDVEELDEGEIRDIYVSGEIHEIDDTEYENKYTGDDVDTDNFPTIDDYLENHTIKYEIPDMTADHHTPAHDFDIRITEIEAE